MKNEKPVCDFRILRELRKQEGLSLAGLSAGSGVSASVLSKLERNRQNVEMDTLYRIARVFGLTLTDLVALAENRISQRNDEERYKSDAFRFRRVSYGNIRCMLASADAGARLSTPEAHRDDCELCWVLRGKLLFTLPKESCVLSAGMSIEFDAFLHHTYEALEDLEMLLIHLRKGKRF